jgi:hypothetical protein
LKSSRLKRTRERGPKGTGSRPAEGSKRKLTKQEKRSIKLLPEVKKVEQSYRMKKMMKSIMLISSKSERKRRSRSD